MAKKPGSTFISCNPPTLPGHRPLQSLRATGFSLRTTSASVPVEFVAGLYRQQLPASEVAHVVENVEELPPANDYRPKP